MELKSKVDPPAVVPLFNRECIYIHVYVNIQYMDIFILYVYQNRTARGKNNIKNKILRKEKVESEDNKY